MYTMFNNIWNEEYNLRKRHILFVGTLSNLKNLLRIFAYVAFEFKQVSFLLLSLKLMCLSGVCKYL